MKSHFFIILMVIVCLNVVKPLNLAILNLAGSVYSGTTTTFQISTQSKSDYPNTVIAQLNCGNGLIQNYTTGLVGNVIIVHYPIYNYFYGNCRMSILKSAVGNPDFTSTPVNTSVYTSIIWITPSPLTTNNILAGDSSLGVQVNTITSITATPLIVLINNATTSVRADLGHITTNTSSIVEIPFDFVRGPASLLAACNEAYCVSNITDPVYVNTQVSFAFPLNDSNYLQNYSIPVQLVAADSQRVEGTVEMTCTNGFSVSHVVNSTLSTDFLSENSGNCTFSIISLDDQYAVAANYSDIIVQVLNYTTISAPARMTVGVASTVYVNTTLHATTDTFNLTFTCGANQQNFTGTYNVPLSVTLNDDMGPYSNCTVSVPETELNSDAITIVDVYATLTFTTISSNPITAGSDLTFKIVASDSASILVLIDMTCTDFLYSSQHNTSYTDLITISVPSYAIGVCPLTATPVNPSLLYTQITAQTVTVNSYLSWIVPEVNSVFLAGTNLDVLVNSSSAPSVALDIYLGNGVSIGPATSNQSTSLTIPIGAARGQVNLIASTSASYYNTPATVGVFINTTVSFASPLNGASYTQLSTIPVRLVAGDGQSVTGSVYINCTDGTTLTQTVQSTSSYSFVPQYSGTCTFTILSVSNDYTVITSSNPIQVNIPAQLSPFGAPVYPLTTEQVTTFATKISFAGGSSGSGAGATGGAGGVGDAGGSGGAGGAFL